MTTPPALRAYRLATRLAKPVVAAWLSDRARRGKEDPARLAERWGQASAPRPDGPLIWLHGASVGESLALIALAERAVTKRSDVKILFTSGTRAAAEVLARRLPAAAIHQYAPVDTPAATRAFARHWRPDLGVFAESEIWPNLLLETKAGGARLALLSAKLSDSSRRGWARAPTSARAVFGAFDLILARDEAEAERLTMLGVQVDGSIDLKFGAPTLPCDQHLIERLRGPSGGPIILAASTHPGEDEIILRAFAEARGNLPGARLIIAPRHPERGEAITKLAAQAGVSTTRRTLSRDDYEASVLVADTVGELGTWYAAATLALIGGSCAPGIGGHNPLEPARLGCPILTGPHVGGWPVYDELVALGAARLVSTDTIATAMAMAWDARPELERMAQAARAFVEERDLSVVAGLDRTLALLP